MSNWHNINDIEPIADYLCLVSGITDMVWLCPANEYWTEGFWRDNRDACYSIRQYPLWVYYDEFIEMMEEE